MAARIAAEGRVTVSERRSIIAGIIASKLKTRVPVVSYEAMLVSHLPIRFN
jgi:hypothetical protein